MISNSAKTFTRGKWAVLFLALLIVPELAFAQTTSKKTASPPKPAPAKTTPPTSTPAPSQPPATQQHDGHGAGSRSGNGTGTGSQGTGGRGTGNGTGTGSQGTGGRGTGNGTDTGTRNTSRLPGGGSRETRANGDTVDRNKLGNPTAVTTHGGAMAKFDQKGHISSVDFKSTKGYDTKVSRSANGGRTVVSEHVSARGEHITMVNTGPNRGYVDHTFTRNGQPYMRRTYVAGGHSYAVMYRGYYYGGRPYFAYVPGYYYAPGFYGWAYAPWGVPVAFAWGWGGAPWYGYSGYYFSPYAVYPGPAFWLTDYVVAENLQAAYVAPPPTPPTTQAVETAQVPPPTSSGLVYTPVYVADTRKLAPGFSETGYVGFDNRLILNAGGAATYSFTVPAGQTETIEYAIPIGGESNGASFEVSANGRELATIDKDPNFVWAVPAKRPLWSKSFGPGNYLLTFRSGGGHVNFYGLWIETDAINGPAGLPADGGNQNARLRAETKDAIASEVKANLASEQANATTTSSPNPDSSNEVPAALDPKQRTFIVSTALTGDATDGSQCSLSAGDILTRVTDQPDTNQKVTALVTSSQKGDCASGSMLAVSIQDLQVMHNAFVERMDAGLKRLASTQGTKGIPSSPAPGPRANPDGQAQPDITAAADLQQQEKDANNAEKDVNQAVAPGQGN